MIAVLAFTLWVQAADDIAKHIRDLEANEIETREKATQALLAIGAKAVEPLEKAAGSADNDAAQRMKQIAGRIKKRSEFRDSLIAGQNTGVSYQHIVNAKQQRTLPDDDLEAILNELSATSGNLMLKNYIVQAVVQLRIIGAIPGLVKMLRDNQAWSYAQNALMQLGATKETSAAVSEMLKDRDTTLVMRAVQLAAALQLRDTAPAVVELLGHADAGMRTTAASTLVQMGLSSEITGRLKSKSAKDRAVTIQTMTTVGLQDCAAVEPLVGDEDAGVRAAALKALALWGKPPAQEEVEKLLGDKDAGVREAAIACAVIHPALAKKVIEALKDESGKVRAAVLERLTLLPLDDVMPVLIAMSGDAATKEQAAYGMAVLLHNAGARVHRVMTEIVGKVDAVFLKSMNTYLETIKASAAPVYQVPGGRWPGFDSEYFDYPRKQ